MKLTRFKRWRRYWAEKDLNKKGRCLAFAAGKAKLDPLNNKRNGY